MESLRNGVHHANGGRMESSLGFEPRAPPRQPHLAARSRDPRRASRVRGHFPSRVAVARRRRRRRPIEPAPRRAAPPRARRTPRSAAAARRTRWTRSAPRTAWGTSCAACAASASPRTRRGCASTAFAPRCARESARASVGRPARVAAVAVVAVVAVVARESVGAGRSRLAAAARPPLTPRPPPPHRFPPSRRPPLSPSAGRHHGRHPEAVHGALLQTVPAVPPAAEALDPRGPRVEGAPDVLHQARQGSTARQTRGRGVHMDGAALEATEDETHDTERSPQRRHPAADVRRGVRRGVAHVRRVLSSGGQRGSGASSRRHAGPHTTAFAR